VKIRTKQCGAECVFESGNNVQDLLAVAVFQAAIDGQSDIGRHRRESREVRLA
jgi:hypothetical protein